LDLLEYSQVKDQISEKAFRERRLALRAADVVQTLDRLQAQQENPLVKLMDFQKVAVMGHSYGGVTAVRAAQLDARVKCAVGLDSWLEPLPPEMASQPLNGPLALINSTEWQWKENLEIQAAVTRAAKPPSFRLAIVGSHHQNFSDAAFYGPIWLLNRLKYIGATHRVTILSLANTLALSFLKESLVLNKEKRENVSFRDLLDRHKDLIVMQQTQ